MSVGRGGSTRPRHTPCSPSSHSSSGRYSTGRGYVPHVTLHPSNLPYSGSAGELLSLVSLSSTDCTCVLFLKEFHLHLPLDISMLLLCRHIFLLLLLLLFLLLLPLPIFLLLLLLIYLFLFLLACFPLLLPLLPRLP